MFFKHGLKSKYDNILKEAEAEAEVIKKNKLLEVKEKFLNKKADLEKEVAIRNQKIQQAENKLKQRELNLNQRQEDLQRKNSEVDAVKENLAAQLELVDKKKQDLEKLHQREIEHLETLSGLSAEEAKERWGDSPAYAQSAKKTGAYTSADWARIHAEMQAVYGGFASCMEEGPASPRAQALVEQWQSLITRYFYDCTDEILIGLGEMYVADERFTRQIDRYAEGLSIFLRDAIRLYCGRAEG